MSYNINMDCIDKKISNILIKNNILPNNIGYKYLRDIIKMKIQDDSFTYISLNKFYQEIALTYNKSVSSIEKAISNVIQKAFNSIYLQNKYGNLLVNCDKLTNKEFIFQLVNQLNTKF